MKKLLSLLKTLSTTFPKSSICTMKRQRNLIFNFTYCLNSPLVGRHKLFCNHMYTCRSATTFRKEGLLATTLEAKQSREFVDKPLG